MEIELLQLARRVGGRVVGDGGVCVRGIAPLGEAKGGELSFLAEDKYAGQLAETGASAVLVTGKYAGAKTPAVLVVVADVEAALDGVLEMFSPAADLPAAGVHKTAIIAESVKLGNGVAIGPNVVISEEVKIGAGTVICAGCVIGKGVVIGEGCRLYPNVVVQWGCKLGDRVIVHANSTIGADGFGYRLVEGKHQKIRHIGIVVVEDDVEIGANACIDRAKFGETVIGRGTKIDNLVQIAHNVKTGEHCIIVSQTGIAGSTRLGRYVVLGGQSGLRDHIMIGDGAMVAAASAVDGDVEAGAKLAGVPAIPVRELFRQISLLKKLPEMNKQLKEHQKVIDELESSKDNR